MAALEELKREVEETKTVINSAITLIGGLAQRLRDILTGGGATEEELQELIDDLDADQADLAAAIVSGTVAEDEPDEGE